MNDNLEYTETLQTYRHYSNLRFAFTTLFATITAGLIIGIYGEALKSFPKWGNFLLSFFGLCLTLVFLYLEWTTAEYLKTLAGHLEKNHERSHIVKFQDLKKSTTSYLFRGLYGFLVFFWTISAIYWFNYWYNLPNK